MVALLLYLSVVSASEADSSRQDARLAELRAVLPASEPWEAWLTRTAEQPPDFEALPSHADLPDPLAGGIATPEAWRARREELLGLFKQWVIGTVPPPPDNLEATVTAEGRQDGASVREVELRFGPDRKARLRLELLLPEGEGPFPVFLTQDNHRGWALIALRRGYAACVYAGADSKDDTDSFPEAYPGYDWSRLTRRAWAAGRCIDYLVTLPQIDAAKIALTGHSRNGKQSLIASAIDERIAVVISSSSGAGGSIATRDLGEHHFGEGIENLTRAFPDWFHPRLRFFAGREHKLPVDLHELVALSAPRPCLLSIALNDGVESSWAMQQTYLAVKPVYALHGAEDKLRILWRPGGHETWPTVIERYLDWCDAQFGRGRYDFPERFIHPYDWEGWRQAAASLPDPAALPERPFGGGLRPRDEVRGAVHEMLGEAPARVASPAGTYGEEPNHIEELYGRRSAGDGLEKHDLMFGEYINADVYMPAGTMESGKRIPAILWLHTYSFPMGYGAAYRRGEQPFRTLARAGYAVFCYDQIGCGRRIEEVEGFYDRYPRWSLLGKMTRDAQAALDAMQELPFVDPQQLWVVGYGMGATVGLHLGAVDDRPAGAVFIAAPPPFRLDTDVAETGGTRRWSHRYLLLPQLGMFLGQEGRVPYDVDELLAAMAPRPVAVVAPRLDREAPLPLMRQAVDSAKRAYGEGALELIVPDAYNHFDENMQRVVTDWLRAHAAPQGK